MKSQRYVKDYRGRFLQRLVRTAGQCVGGLLLLVGVFLLCPLSGVHAQTEVGGPITTNTDWTNANSPYLVTSDIYVGAPENDGTTITLTIEAGVEVRFQPGTGLYIGQNTGGALIAIGGEAEADHILFTSHAATPGAGDWKGIWFGNYTDDTTSVLQYVTVQYGGSGQANVTCYLASPAITHSKILNSSKHGLYLRSSSSRIANNTIQNNNFNGIWMQYANGAAIEQNIITENNDSGVYAYRSQNISMTGNDLITNNDMGIYVEGYSSNIGQYRNVSITGNTVENNDDWGIYVEYVSDVTLTNNTIRGNYDEGIYIYSTSAVTISDSNIIEHNSDDGIYVEYSSDIIITGNTITENSYNGIYVGYEESEGDVTITNNIITENDDDGIYWNWSSGSIEGNTITGNAGNGISNYFPSTQISNNDLSNNEGYPISTSLENMPYLSDNSGSGNGNDAIAIWGGETITSDTNWTKNMWSHPSFPYVITGPIRIYSYTAPYPTLTLEPGLELQFTDNGGIIVGTGNYYGILSAKGTPNDPVHFMKAPQAENWQGIRLQATQEGDKNILEFCIIEYASSYGIYIENNASTRITNSEISNNGEYPISAHPNSLKDMSDNRGSGNGTKHTDDGKNYDAIEIRGGDITSDCTWSKQAFPYVVTNHVHVRAPDASSPTATLTIEPGTEVQFAQGRGIYIGESGRPGALYAEGTENNPIIFTSNLESPTPGSWTGIIFQDATDDAYTILKHGIIEYATTGINIQHASPAIEVTTFQQNKTGIILNGENAAPRIVENTFSNNTEFGINKYKACEYNAASCPPAEIARNTFSDHGICGIRMSAANGDNLYDNFGSGTGSAVCIGWYNRGYWSCCMSVQTNSVWKKNDPSLPYMVRGSISIYNWDENVIPTLTIEPGVDLRFDDQDELAIGSSDCWEYGCSYNYGRIVAQGTEDFPILFTSNADVPQPGDWRGIRFEAQKIGHEPSILEHCVIEYAGSQYSGNAAVVIGSPAPLITNTLIRETQGHGIYGSGVPYDFLTNDSPIRISGNIITDNQESAFYLDPNLVKYIGDNSGSRNGENAVKIRGGSVLSHGIWSKLSEQALPYVVSGDIYVGSLSQDNPAILVLEPGLKLRFESGRGLYIGQRPRYGRVHYGAISARGTTNDPIILTSNTAAPGPGDWKGVFFGNDTNDAASFLEHTLIEYGGHTHNSNVYLEHAAPTIQYSTVRASSESGIRVNGNGSDGVVINCNNFSENLYGVHVTGNAQPEMHTNNFLGNTMYGVYNTGSSTINAEQNWWGDANGPNQTGDQSSGNVDYEPYLTAESSCILAPPTNSPPFAPSTPLPANEAVKVAVTDGSVTLNWVGGDPNPWDTVEYDVWFGDSAAALAKVATTNPNDTQYVKDTLDGGTRYFWKIVARDDKGLETEGPVWQFITQGDPPDLIVSEITWEPAANIENKQNVTFTATIKNVGTGPVVGDRFLVEYRMNGSYFGAQWVSQILFPGESVQLTWSWTAQIGTHTFTVFADSNNWTNVAESNEDNNTLSVTLPPIQDTVPPEVVSTNPADGATVQAVSQIEIRLRDQHGTVDDEAVKSSITIVKDNTQPVNGTVSETNDRFTFSPENSPLADGLYQVSFTAKDTSGNTQPHTFSFTVDGQPPAAPTITGGNVSPTGQIQPGKDNRTNNATITLTGTREENTSVWIDDGTVDSRRVNLGSGDWSVNLSLKQGDNTLNIYLKDQADNSSPSVQVNIIVDSVAPTVVSIDPADNSSLSAVPATVAITIQEDGSGLKLEDSIYALKNGSMANVPGAWEESGGNQLVFTPNEPLGESEYTIVLQLADQFGNQSSILQYHFSVDTTPPPAPVIDPVVSPTQHPQQTISGTKEAYAAILLDGQEIVDHTAATTWQYPITLNEGENTFTFVARSRAGADSEEIPVSIFYDNTPPSPVTTLTVDAEDDGTRAILDWSGYDESAQGDVASYHIYVEPTEITGVANLQHLNAEIAAGTLTYTVENLIRNTTYWFAVVPVDGKGQTPAEVNPVVALVKDTVPPEDVTNLQVFCFEDRLTFTWNPSANSHNDLAGYRAYIGGNTTGEDLTSETSSYEQTGLSSATAYPMTITAVDNDGNESSGVTITGITLLDNPATLTTDAQSGYVDLTWASVGPAQYLQHYAIYVSETEFATVDGMTPALTTTATEARITGLTNNTTYYFAVTAVNQAGGEDKNVTPVSATPEPDIQGPVLSNVQVDGVPLTDGHTLTKPVKFSAKADDPSGVNRVEFFIAGPSLEKTLLRTDYHGSPAYFSYWDIATVPNDVYTLSIVAYDTPENSTTATYTVQVELAAPPAPVITQPPSGMLTNQPTIQVSGVALPSSEVQLFNNDEAAGAPAATDEGNFSIPLTLQEGINQIQATARYRSDPNLTGPRSEVITVMLDTSRPPAPTNLKAESREGGEIKLTWRAPSDTSIKGYRFYRSPASFANITLSEIESGVEGIELLNAHDLITGTTYYDFPATDGEYYYRITMVSHAGNESELSEEVMASSDRLPPKAMEITYTSSSPLAGGGTFPPGTVELTVTVSEPLQTAPFLSITPENGFPISLDLTPETATPGSAGASPAEYSASFEITESTPSGTAYAVFSARDLAGNRGTEIDVGGSIEIDTDGPAVKRLVIQPEHPIQNDAQNPVTVTITIGLTDTMKAGEAPQLSYELSGPGRTPVLVENLNPVDPQSGEVQAWQGSFILPSDAGLNAAEILQFAYQGVDDLGNISEAILCASGVVASEDACATFQVYQGNLPVLDVPTGLTAESLPGGRIKLTWNAVDEAAGYQLYRQAPGETELTLVPQTSPFVTRLEYIDETSEDGTYTYAVASVRQQNEQIAVSERSDPVEAIADATVPAAPQNLTLELVPQGMGIRWEDPVNTEPVTYRLYRASGMEITADEIAGLTPRIPTIPSTYMATGIVDDTPSTTEPCYALTAVDELGNESAPSNSVYHNIGLLPVSSLHVRQQDHLLPVISWSHQSENSLAGYNVVVGTEGEEVPLNTTILTGQSYTDTGYIGKDRRYTVTAVDNNGMESLGRSITLPSIQYSVISNQESGVRIKRGIMNRLEYEVENLSSERIHTARLNVEVGSVPHTSSFAQSLPFTLEPGESQIVPVIVGGYADLPDLADVTTTIEITPNPGEKIEIVRTSQIEVGDGMLVMRILNEEFTRGVTGTVRFSLENTGEEEIEIITASGGGDSSDIRYYLLDKDGNVLSSVPFKQLLGQGSVPLVTLANGNIVARIPAGGIFESAATTLPVPANAPDTLEIRLNVARLYYHQGKPDQVVMDGPSTTHQISLRDTSYYGEIFSITPDRLQVTNQTQTGQAIVINGRAVERATGQPLPEVLLNLTISVSGFDRTYDIFTGSDGTFTYTFTPLPGESGMYTVRAVHPDLRDRPVHGTFVIERVSIRPSGFNLELPKNYPKTSKIFVTAGEGTQLTNPRLIYLAADQPGGLFPQGVHVTVETPDCQLPTANCQLPFTIWADATAAESNTLVLKVTSDERGDEGWGKILVNTIFHEPTPPRPKLFISPDYVETGVMYDDSVTETVMLKNTGDADLHDVSLNLVADPDGTPAPTWISLNTSANLGTIASREQREVRLSFHPDTSVGEEDYTFFLRIVSAELQPIDFALYVTVTQSGTGHVLFKLSDIYTGTQNDQGAIIQGLEGAKIRLQHETLPTLVVPGQISDPNGETEFRDLPVGRYLCRITAEDHKDYSGRFWIKPGLTTIQEVFLEYELITVEWEVKDIPIQDTYIGELKTTFKTDVPAAVVVAEPASITLPPMQAGDVHQGEFTLVNYGLIRADNLHFELPPDNQYYTYELLAGLPTSLGAKERITVPYRVTRVQDVPGEGDASGGGVDCGYLFRCAFTTYTHDCANGNTTTHSIHQPCFNEWLKYCTGGSSGSGGYGGGWMPYWDDEFIVSEGWQDDEEEEYVPRRKPDSAPTSLKGADCFPEAEGDECWSENLCQRPQTCHNTSTQSGSLVNNLTRQYSTTGPVLAIKIPGGTLRVLTRYKDGQWLIEPARSDMNGLPVEASGLSFHYYGDAARGQIISGIVKDGNLAYNLPPENFALKKEYDPDGTLLSEQYVYTGEQIYLHKKPPYKIVISDEGYLWKGKSGDWKIYDDQGRLLSSGGRYGALVSTLYDTDGKVSGYADRDGTQVIWFDYNADGRIEVIRDAQGRQISYTYDSNGRLWKAEDVLHKETTYEYDDQNRLKRVRKPGGRESNITYDASGNVVAVTDEQGQNYLFDYDYDTYRDEYYTMITYPSGTIKEVWYDEEGRTKRVDIDGETVQAIVQEDNALLITDEDGEETRKEYDEWGNLTKVVYPDGSEESYAYEHTHHRRIKAVDKDGTVTRYEYDQTAGHLLREIKAAGTAEERITEYTYTPDDRLETITEKGDGTTPDAVTTYEYDAVGNLVTITKPDDSTIEKTYDARGNVVTWKDKSGEWKYTYDDEGHLISITESSAGTTP